MTESHATGEAASRPPTAPTLALDPDTLAAFDANRGLLFGVAYRLLGQVADAEDVVQEAWLRWTGAPRSEVQDPRAFLVRTTTRLALDRLRRAKVRRETYVGPWLPEPLLTGPDVADRVELAETISLALLIVLETLTPLERAVFVLHEAFGFSFPEIAEAVGRNEAAVRQVAHRARAHVEARRPRFGSDDAIRQRVTEQFLSACGSGDLQDLLDVLAPDVVLLSDSGGRVQAARQPIVGADRVARFLQGIWPRLPAGTRVRLADLNGRPGLLGTAGEQPVGAVLFDVADGRVKEIYFVVNPDKLSGLAAGSTTG